MQLSIIIPTHNRKDQLKKALTSILALKEEVAFEVIVIDNNSTDNTKDTVNGFHNKVRYYFEPNTSFTKARNIAGHYAQGDIMLFIDDDVIIKPGSLKRIVEIFKQNKDCGVVAGKILPKFIQKPPAWTLECQKIFNGWSLYNPEENFESKSKIQTVGWAAGPMMAVRKDILNKVKGFPPDTVGLETDRNDRSFRKLYIGPGDYGLCYKIRNIGYKILFSYEVAAYHVISPIRYTVSFWRSRVIGEAQHKVISQKGFFRKSPLQSLLKTVKFTLLYKIYEKKLLKKLSNSGNKRIEGVSTDELWVHYYQAYLDMDRVLNRFPKLWKFLWHIGIEGVDNKSYVKVKEMLPQEYLDLVSSTYMYNSDPIVDTQTYYLFKNRINRS